MRFVKVIILSLMLLGAAEASAVNVALGKPVTSTGQMGLLGPTFDGLPATEPLTSITDGLFKPEVTYWQEAAWWDENEPQSAGNVIEIDLLGAFRIFAAKVQADNNDVYEIEYRRPDKVWLPLTTVGTAGPFWLVTRDVTFPAVVAEAVRVRGRDGDLYYSISEVQLFAVPEPVTVSMVAIALPALLLLRRVR